MCFGTASCWLCPLPELFLRGLRDKPGGQTVEPEDYSQALKSKGICPARFQTFLGPVVPIFLPISPFWNGNGYPLPVPLY